MSKLVKKDGPFLGVCAGLGDYFGMDPVIIRLIFVVGLTFEVVPAFLTYMVLAICMDGE
jgi:phage shock protein C